MVVRFTFIHSHILKTDEVQLDQKLFLPSYAQTYTLQTDTFITIIKV